jgi:hypothetical protein
LQNFSSWLHSLAATRVPRKHHSNLIWRSYAASEAEMRILEQVPA